MTITGLDEVQRQGMIPWCPASYALDHSLLSLEPVGKTEFARTRSTVKEIYVN